MHSLILATTLSAATDAAPAAARASGVGGAPVVLPGLALLALAAAALYASRRARPVAGRALEVVETASLGPRRSLVVARVGREALVLGVSEAGIALLASKPAAELLPAAASHAAANASFEQVLRASAGAGPSEAELELRRKLQQAAGGSAR